MKTIASNVGRASRWLRRHAWWMFSGLCALAGAGYVAWDQPAVREWTYATAEVAGRKISYTTEWAKGLAGYSAWDATLPLLEESDRESLASIDQAIARIDGHLATAKKGAPAFADEVTGLEFKAMYLIGGTQQNVVRLWNAAKEYFNQETISQPADMFRDAVGDRFDRLVLDDYDFQEFLKSVVAAQRVEIDGIEARLLVKLRADLPDAESGPSEISEGFKITDAAGAVVDDVSGLDFADIIVSFLIDRAAATINAILAELADSLYTTLTGREPAARTAAERAAAWGSSWGSDVALSRAIQNAAKEAGYDPAARVTASVTATLDQVRDALVEGDAASAKRYDTMVLLALGHDDEAVRRACASALAAMDRDRRVGLRHKMHAAHLKRSASRRAAIYRLSRGPDASPPSPFALDERVAGEPDALIEFARESEALYGKEDR